MQWSGDLERREMTECEKCDPADTDRLGHGRVAARLPSPQQPPTHRGARAVLPPLWDLCLVGVVGAADHGAGGGQPAASTPRSTAARLPAWQALLLQFRLPRAGWAALGVQGCRGWATW